MSLQAFIDAKARWLVWLNGDELHSINGQLSQLLWQDAVFRSFNAARMLAQQTGPSAAVSPILARFLDEGYVASIVLGVSKLVEWSNPKQPTKGVVSLRRLIDELILHRPLLTRENYLAAANAPYDFAPTRDAALRAILERSSGGVSFEWQAVGGSGDWQQAERMHEQFDRLSGVEPGSRHPGDLISEALLGRLDAALNETVFEKIRTLRHKSVAHAADAASRPQQRIEGLTLNDVDIAMRLLLGVRQVVQAGILFDSWRAGSVPVPQQDQFEHLDAPFVSSDDMGALRTFWSGHCKERDEWLNESYQALLDG